MELPTKLKKLYRHWRFHTTPADGKYSFKQKALQKQVERFVAERMHVWEQRQAGKLPPYTKDPIIGRYRFCNILRELDRQTIEYHELLNPLRDDFPLWLLNMFYCRMVARPETVRQVGLLSFDEKKNEALYERLRTSSRPRYGTPYVFPVSVIMRSTTPTRETFIARYLPEVMRKVAKEIETWKKESVADGVDKVLPLFGYNLSFLWTEVLIDVAYQYPQFIDLYTRFPVGPGSLPTMKRIDSKTDPSKLAAQLANTSISSGITFNGKPVRLSAENWEGIGCEFRKYTNLKTGSGRRRVYSPKGANIAA